MVTPDSDASNETAVYAARGLSADALAVDPPPEFESTRPNNGGTVCGGEFGEFGAQIYTTGDGVAGSAVDVGYTRDSSQRHVQANNVENSAAGSAADIGYTHGSSQRHAQANNVKGGVVGSAADIGYTRASLQRHEQANKAV